MSGVDIEPLKVAVLGCGSVGSQVVRLLDEQADDLAARIGAPVELVALVGVEVSVTTKRSQMWDRFVRYG